MEPQSRKRNKKKKNTGKPQQHPNGVKREVQPKAAKPKQDRISPPKKSSAPSSPSTSRSSGIKTALCVILFSLTLGGGLGAWYMWNDGVGQIVEHYWTYYGFANKDILGRIIRLGNYDRVEPQFEETYNFQKNEDLINEKAENPKGTENEEADDGIRPDVVERYEDIEDVPADEIKSKLDDHRIGEEYEVSQDEFFKNVNNDQPISDLFEHQIHEETADRLNDEVHADYPDQPNDRHERDVEEYSRFHVAEEKYSKETQSSSSQANRKSDKGQVDEEQIDSRKFDQEGSEPRLSNYDSEGLVADNSMKEGSSSKDELASRILEGIQKLRKHKHQAL